MSIKQQTSVVKLQSLSVTYYCLGVDKRSEGCSVKTEDSVSIVKIFTYSCCPMFGPNCRKHLFSQGTRSISNKRTAKQHRDESIHVEKSQNYRLKRERHNVTILVRNVDVLKGRSYSIKFKDQDHEWLKRKQETVSLLKGEIIIAKEYGRSVGNAMKPIRRITK